MTTSPSPSERELFPLGLARCSEKELRYLRAINADRSDQPRVDAVDAEFERRGLEPRSDYWLLRG